MPTPRSSGERAVTSSSPKKMEPPLASSRPQIMFSVVLLPQPEGPKRPTSSPSGISQVKSLTAITSSGCFLPRPGNFFVRFFNIIFIIIFSLHRFLLRGYKPIAPVAYGQGLSFKIIAYFFQIHKSAAQIGVDKECFYVVNYSTDRGKQRRSKQWFWALFLFRELKKENFA